MCLEPVMGYGYQYILYTFDSSLSLSSLSHLATHSLRDVTWMLIPLLFCLPAEGISITHPHMASDISSHHDRDKQPTLENTQPSKMQCHSPQNYRSYTSNVTIPVTPHECQAIFIHTSHLVGFDTKFSFKWELGEWDDPRLMRCWL